MKVWLVLCCLMAALSAGCGCEVPTEEQLKGQLYVAENRDISTYPLIPVAELGVYSSYVSDDCPANAAAQRSASYLRLRSNTPWQIRSYSANHMSATAVQFYPFSFNVAECCTLLHQCRVSATNIDGMVLPTAATKVLLVNTGRCNNGLRQFWPIRISIPDACYCTAHPFVDPPIISD